MGCEFRLLCLLVIVCFLLCLLWFILLCVTVDVFGLIVGFLFSLCVLLIVGLLSFGCRSLWLLGVLLVIVLT